MIGVLAVQGAFAEHEKVLDLLGEPHFQIRQSKDLSKGMDGIILPGGESTVIGKLLRDLGMMDVIRGMILDGMPVFGTCAGLILLSKEISNSDDTYLGTMPICTKRNAYGRQSGSFSAVGDMKDVGEIPMEFIRAPVIESVSDGVDILSEVDGRIVAARYRDQLVTAFHPELTDDIKVHEYFLDICIKHK